MFVVKRILIMVVALAAGCGALDESDSDNSPVELGGLWQGTTNEQGVTEALTTTVLFFNNQVFVLREDEAHIGEYMVLENNSAAFNTAVYSYATPDTTNNFYVGARSSSRIEVNALFASELSLFINFEGSNRSGSATLEKDIGQEANMTLARVRGTWKTSEAILYINDEGGLQGSNSATGCQWKGTLKPLSGEYLTLSIERKLCAEFNQTINTPTAGFALIDGEGSLHLIAEQPNEFLWMRFAPDTTTGAAEDAAGDDAGDDAADDAAAAGDDAAA